MNFQAIRKHFEQPVVDVAVALDIEYRPENTLEPGQDAAGEFLLSRLQFGDMSETTLCGNLRNVRGAFVIEFFCPKGAGPARAQEVMEAVFCAMMETPGTRDLNGPSFTSLDGRPYFFASLSMAIIVNSSIVPAMDPDDTPDPPVITDVTTADVALTNPTRSAFEGIETTVISEPGAGVTTQEDANQYFARVIDELDEAVEANKDYSDLSDLEELI